MNDDLILTNIADKTMADIMFADNISLYHGKAGAAVFLYALSRRLGNPYYADFADELMDCICSEVSIMQPVDIENGICGIGWAIIYLWVNGYIEADLDEVLKDVDLRTFERNISLTSDHSIRTGSEGILNYLSYRLNNSDLVPDQIIPPAYFSTLNGIKIPYYESGENIWNDFIKFCDSYKGKDSWQQGMSLLNKRPS